jgi:hypothetical protein
MFEQITSGFIKGETYYVKIKKGIIIGDLLFDTYDYSKMGVWFDTPYKHCGYNFQLNDIIVYRYITKKEYYAKVKEKYEYTCLNLVLKRLVNETFEW